MVEVAEVVEVVAALVVAVIWHSEKHVLRRGFGRGFTLGPSFGKIVGDFVAEDSLMSRNPDKGEGVEV